MTNGPTLAAMLRLDVFAIYGVVRDGSPIGLEYSTNDDADVTLTVTDGSHVWTEKLQPGPHSVRLQYDVRGWKGSGVGMFAVQAVKHTPNGDQPSAVEVYGIGAGVSALGPIAANDRDPAPRLVRLRYDGTGVSLVRTQAPVTGGSGGGGGVVAIDNLSFGPPTLQARQGEASFSYMREAAFQRVVANVLAYPPAKLTSTPTGQVWVIDAKPIWQDPAPPVFGKGSSGPRRWNGVDDRNQVSTGAHRLQVRGWMVGGDDGWVATLSQQTVDVR
jgi:hypothetical protein